MAVPIVTPTQLNEGYDDLRTYANRIYAQGQEERDWTPVEVAADWNPEVHAVAARDATTRKILEHGGQTFFVVAHRGSEPGHVWLARVVERYSWRDGRNTRQVEYLDPSGIGGVGPAEFNGTSGGYGPYVGYEFIPFDGSHTHPGSEFANKGNPLVNRDLGNVQEAPEGETVFPIETAHPGDLFGSIPFSQGNQLYKSTLEEALADAQRLNASNGTAVMLAYQDKGGNSYVVWVPRSAAQDALDLLGASREIVGSADLIKAQNGLTVLLPESAFVPETDGQPANILNGIVPVQPAGDPIELVYGSDDLRALTAQQSPEELRRQILDRESFPKYYLERKVVRVTIVGEAGLGQSRAVIQLLEKDPNTGQRVVTGTTVASAQGVPGLTDLVQLFELNPVLAVQYWHVPDDFNFETDNEKWLFRISVTGGGVSARVGLTAWNETDSKQGRVTAAWELQNRWATTWTVLRDPGFSKADKLAALRDLALALPPSGLSGFFASIRNDGVTRKLTGLPPSTGEVRDRRNPQPTLEPSELEPLIIGVQEARDEEELGDVLELYGIESELVDQIIDPSTQRELSTNELTDDEPTDDGVDEGSEPEGPSGQDLDADPDPDTSNEISGRSTVNPGLGVDNCVYCAVVEELGMRGVNLNASPVVHDDPQDMIQLVEEFAQDSGRSGSYTRVWNRYGSGENASALRNKVLEYGENSRWIAVAHRRIGEDGHAFNIEVRDGEVRFVDAQAHSGPVEANLDGRQVIERDGEEIEHTRYRFFDLYRVDPVDPNPDYSRYRFFEEPSDRPTDPGGPPVAGPGDESLIPEATTQPTILNPDEVPEGFLPTIGRPLGRIDPLTGAGWGQLPNPTDPGLPLPPPPDPSIGDSDTPEADPSIGDGGIPEAPEAEPVIPEEPGDIPTIGSGLEGYDPLTGAELKGEPVRSWVAPSPTG